MPDAPATKTQTQQKSLQNNQTTKETHQTTPTCKTQCFHIILYRLQGMVDGYS